MDVWEKPEILRALTDGEYGELLRAWRKATGTAQAVAASLCGLAQSDVSAIENRRRRVTSVAVRDRILAGLDVPAALRPLPSGASTIPSLGPVPDGDTAERVDRAVGSDRLDPAVLEYLSRTLAEHRRIEDRLGARTLLPVVAAQADILERLARYAPAGLHDDALSLLAQYHQFVAWMCHDQQDDGAALRHFGTAETLSQEAGDPVMAAHVLSMKAHIAWSKENWLASARFAEAAQWADGKLTPGAAGMATQVHARALALLRDAGGADAAQERAQALLARAAAAPEDEPPWLYFYDADGVWLAMQQGSVQLDLGRAERAVTELEEALDRLDPSYVRDAAWYRAVLVRALATAGRVEEAAAEAMGVLPDAQATNGFAMKHLVASSRLLTRRAPGNAAVSELAEALASAR